MFSLLELLCVHFHSPLFSFSAPSFPLLSLPPPPLSVPILLLFSFPPFLPISSLSSHPPILSACPSSPCCSSPLILSCFLLSYCLSFLPSSPSPSPSSTPSMVFPQTRTPWLRIFTSWPVWAILIVYICYSWGFYTLLTSLPTYLKDTQGIDIKSVSALNVYVCACVCVCAYSDVTIYVWCLPYLPSSPSPPSLPHIQNGLLSAIPFAAMATVGIFWGYVTDFFRRRGIKTVIARKFNSALGVFGKRESCQQLSSVIACLNWTVTEVASTVTLLCVCVCQDGTNMVNSLQAPHNLEGP